MTRILLTPIETDGRANSYSSISAWRTDQRPVEGIYNDIQPGGGVYIDLPAPAVNVAWHLILVTPDGVSERLVSFSGDSASWDSLVDVDPGTLTPLPQNAALAEWQIVLDQLRSFQKDPGPMGPPGLPGTKGETGPRGIQGIQGEKGEPGVKGDKGDPGTNGIDGVNGIDGAKGDQGIQGIQGVKGDQGIQGIQGLKGDQGIQGIQGLKGDQGIQGIQGTPGATGPSGLPTYANLAGFSAGTFIGQLAVALDSGITYRWMGSTPKWYPWHSGWITYTTTVAGATIGTGAVVNARYRWENGFVRARTFLAFGSSPAITGQVSVTLPEPARIGANLAFPYFTGSVIVRDAAGSNWYPGVVLLTNASTAANLYVQNAAGTYLSVTAMTATGIPIAVAQSEQIFTDVLYESNNYPQ